MSQHMGTSVIYLFPLAFDIIVSIALFAGRHSLAERGMDTRTVGSIVAIYGVSYILSSLFMGKIIRPALARAQMLLAVVITVVLLCLLANTEQVRLIQILFCGIPFATSLFFNAFQSFMLGVGETVSKPVTRIVAHYTFAWSIGYALGPALSAALKGGLGWPASYYTAAVTAAAVGLIAFLFKPPVSSPGSEARREAGDGPSLCIPAWAGLLFGWTGWNMLVTYWPVHAQALGFPAGVKGLVEFSFAMSQSLTALLLSRVRPSYYRRTFFSLVALTGVAGALFFAANGHAAFFTIGAVLFGVYSGHFFCNMVFHSAAEPYKAVKRVALNETFVGICFLSAPVLAAAIKAFAGNFRASYVWVALFLAAGAAVQAGLTVRERP